MPSMEQQHNPGGNGTLPPGAEDSRAPVSAPGHGSSRQFPVQLRRSFLLGRPHFYSGLAARSPGLGDLRPDSMKSKPSVDLAVKQWHGLVEVMRRYGADVLAAQPDRALPELAFMGAAGFLADRSARTCVGDKTFMLATLEPRLQPLRDGYARTLRGLGFRVEMFDHRFGGAVDFFRCGPNYVFVCGPEHLDEGEPSAARRLLSMLAPRQPAWSSDPRLRETLAEMVTGREVHQLTLCDPRFCRGDMVATGVGEDRKVLVVYVKALAEESQRLILGRKARVSETVIPLSDHDAAMYAAGALQLTHKNQGGKPVVIVPEGVTNDLVGRLERAGCEVVLVNLSEWIKKDRGGPAAMALDLGYLRDDRRTETPEVKDMRIAMRQGLDQAPALNG